MAAGNRHLGYKEVLNALEERSPGTKAAFLFGFLERGHERFAADADDERDELGACTVCGAPTPGEVCAFCRLRASASASSPSTLGSGRRTWRAPFAAGDRVLLVDAKRRRHLITLVDGRRSSTPTPASLAHDDIIGQPDGVDRAHDARRRASSRCGRRSPSTCSRCRAARR